MREKFPAIIPFVFPGIPAVRCYFTTRLYGNLSLDACPEGKEREETLVRRGKLSYLLDFSSWTELRQVHGQELLPDPDSTPMDVSSSLEADGLATGRSDHALLIKAADCQTIMLAHRDGRYVAALHCGWRGNVLEFPEKGVAAFCRAYSLKAEDVLAVRGPSLGPGAAEFLNVDREWPDHFRPWFNAGNKCMDLWSLTRHQLLQAGLRPEHIFSLDLCTHALGGEDGCFFSYRHGHAGRQGALIFGRG